jgi:O-antigen/teichoic acid export membrane protein
MSASKNADGNLAGLVRAKFLANVGGAVLVLSAAGYFAFGREGADVIVYGLVATAILFPVYNISDVWISWLNGKSRFAELATGRMVTAALSLISVGLLVVLGVAKLWVAAALYFFLMSIQNILMLGRSFSLRTNNEQDEGAIAFGRHATVAMMFSSLMAIDVLVLEYFHSLTEVAIYAIALLFPEQIKALFAIFNQVFTPRMCRSASVTEFWMGFRIQFFLLTAGFVMIGVVGFLLIPVLTVLLFSERYVEAAKYGKWLWVTVAVLGSSTFLGIALTSMRKRIALYASAVGYPVLLTVLFVAMARRGVEGMVVARMTATAFLAVFYVVAFNVVMKQEGQLGKI